MSIFMYVKSMMRRAGTDDMNDKPRVLFLCAHNSARSQMAEALLRHHAGERLDAASAGLRPTAVHPLARTVLSEIGVDHSGLHAKPIREFFGGTSIQYAIIVCEPSEAECPRLFPFATRTLYWPLDDPTTADGDLGLAQFRRVRDEIDARLRAWLQGMRTHRRVAAVPRAIPARGLSDDRSP
jgi:arsenate reductase